MTGLLNGDIIVAEKKDSQSPSFADAYKDLRPSGFTCLKCGKTHYRDKYSNFRLNCVSLPSLPEPSSNYLPTDLSVKFAKLARQNEIEEHPDFVIKFTKLARQERD